LHTFGAEINGTDPFTFIAVPKGKNVINISEILNFLIKNVYSFPVRLLSSTHNRSGSEGNI
jgi:hypothetical protein